MGNILAFRLRQLRNEKRLTQEMMAKEFLVPRVTYTHYELGNRTPDIDMLIRIAQYHHVSVDYLIGNSHFRLSLEHWLTLKGYNPDKLDDHYIDNLMPIYGERVAEGSEDHSSNLPGHQATD